MIFGARTHNKIRDIQYFVTLSNINPAIQSQGNTCNLCYVQSFELCVLYTGDW